MSRSLCSAMTMDLRRSEDEKERASHLHDVGEALAIAQRVQLGQPSPTVACLRRALGHTIKQGSSQSSMIGVTKFEGLAPRTERRPFCERRALASPDASSRRRLVRRFPKCVTRMYLPRSSASRDSSQIKTGSWRRRVAMTPSGRHGRAVSEAAGKGTGAWTARRHLEGPT